MLSLLKDVALWMRENQIEKLKSVEVELMDKLFSNKLIGKDEEFFDLVGPEVHQLNRNFPAETYFTDKIRANPLHCIAVR